MQLSHPCNFHGVCDPRSMLQKFPLGVTKRLNLRALTGHCEPMKCDKTTVDLGGGTMADAWDDDGGEGR